MGDTARDCRYDFTKFNLALSGKAGKLYTVAEHQRYGTVMVNVETRKIIDMIESRETNDVCKWLEKHPNIRVVSRDGSQQYASAVTKSHPGAMQVSDRFHLVKNLNDRANDVFNKIFQGRIAIPITRGTQDIRYAIMIATAPEQIRIVKRLRSEGRNKSELGLLTGLSARTISKYVEMRACDIPEVKQTVRGKGHEEAVKKLSKRAEYA